jgi:starch phosphorylase
LKDLEERCRAVDDRRLWEMRATGRKSLVEYARQRFLRQEADHGASPLQLHAARAILDRDTLTLGFARRFATYKRPTLLLSDPDRLARILTNPQRPVQLVLAGKAHPNDKPGQALIRDWTAFARRPDVRSHVVFLSDYDMLLAERLMEGVDVWINTPRRPWEASGTSGMKVLVNGGLNLSVLDGWWAEAYSPEVGWAIGDDHGDASDRADAEALYAILENQVVPAFYDRDDQGIPRSWVARIRNSMATLTPSFSANRTVRQYTEEHYLPAAAAYAARGTDGGNAGAGLCAWNTEIARRWRDVRFGALEVHTRDGEMTFDVEVHLGGLDPGAVRVELYAESQDGGAPIRQEMQRGASRTDGSAAWVYSGGVRATRSPVDFTPRVIPRHALAAPVEIDRILWQK